MWRSHAFQIHFGPNNLVAVQRGLITNIIGLISFQTKNKYCKNVHNETQLKLCFTTEFAHLLTYQRPNFHIRNKCFEIFFVIYGPSIFNVQKNNFEMLSNLISVCVNYTLMSKVNDFFKHFQVGINNL